MKNKNKTIIEANKGSISKKIGRFAVIVVLYIAIVTTLAFIMSTINIFVNADSVGGGNIWSNPYTYSSMYIYTDNGAYCVGSNDYFTNSTDNNISFDDYYSILTDEEEMYFYITYNDDTYIYVLPVDNLSFRNLLINYGTPDASNCYYYYDVNNETSLYSYNYDLESSHTYGLFFSPVGGGGQTPSVFNLDTIITDNDVFDVPYGSGGGNDVPETEEPSASNEYWRPTDGPSAYSLNSRAVADSPISIKRLNTATYNSSGNYYSIFSEITSSNIIGFDFNFTKDIAVTYAQLTNNEFYYNYSMTNDYSITKSYNLLYYDIDGNLTSQEITSVISYDSGDTGTLLPTLTEIEYYIGEDNIGGQDIYLIQDLFVSTNSSIVIDTDYVHIFEWLAYNPTRTKQITNDYVNNFYRSTKIDVGEILLNSVNSFLKFELIPGFSLLSLLALVIGIPLLIYILKLFLGG